MKKKYDQVLIIDDNQEILVALRIFLRNYFKDISTLNSPSDIHSTVRNNPFDLILLDMNFKAGDRSGNEGIFWLREILKIKPESIVICITAYGDIQLAVKAMQHGATDFIEKPWNEEHLLASILRAAKLNETKKQINKLTEKNKQLAKQNTTNLEIIRGTTARMRNIWQTVEKIAPTDANVLLTGENGSGKEIIAKSIHHISPRAENPFITIDLGSLTPTLFESELFGHVKGSFTHATTDKTGWFEIADQGTLFLDEIANLSPEQQAKLLSVIQNKEITRVGSTQTIPLDIRIISATNAPLEEMVSSGKFREDLLYRLNTIHITLPPLRERRADIPELVDFYLQKFKAKYKKPGLTLQKSVIHRLENYSWPGNIRELKHTIERAVILSDGSTLSISAIYPDNRHPETEKLPNNGELNSNLNLDQNEKKLIRSAINQAKGNYTKASELLGISRRTLYNKIEKYGLQ
ncbi:MAG: sigma-54 dependent transcriptional regulator [Bacteroidales bacterium]|jgi:DNA-binding NtrC family response regulator|nr:sigma-54 dependent transcriptional regulator [Bacteroidales bacterium]